MPEFCLLIPARDEARTLPGVIATMREAAAGSAMLNVIVIDDGSRDHTPEVAAASGATVLRHEQSLGLAQCFREGVRRAVELGADYIVHTDADGQYQAGDLPPLLRAADLNTLVVGDRLHVQPDGMSDFRYHWNKRLSELVGVLAGQQVADGQSGFRVFSATLAQDCPIKSDYTYTQEQVIRAARQGYKIEQPKISFSPRRHGKSRLVRSPLFYISHTTADLDRLCAELGIDLETWLQTSEKRL